MKRILCGPHAVDEAVRASPGRVQAVYVAREAKPGAFKALADQARKHGVTVEELPRSELDALARGVRHQDVVGLTGDYPYANFDDLLRSPAGSPLLLVLLDGIEDPRNLGAIVRSAVGFGAHGVVMPRDRAAPMTAAAVRTSAGASEHARIARVTNLAETIVALKERGILTVGLAAEAPAALSDLDLRTDVALVVGNEGAGLRRLTRERCDRVARLPLEGPIASLNASAAAAIALYEVARQRRGAP